MLLDENSRVKVADFGLSEFLQGKAAKDMECAKGTPLYSAPEVLLKKEFDFSIDVYALGMILYELFFEKRIFQNHTQLEPFIHAVCYKNERPQIPAPPPQQSPPANQVKASAQLDPNYPPLSLVSLIRRCWDGDAKKRPTFAQILDELDIISLEATISDQVASKFWKHKFSKPNLKTEVKWEEFAQAVGTYTLQSTSRLEPLRPLLCASETDPAKEVKIVTMQRFYLLTQWFG